MKHISFLLILMMAVSIGVGPLAAQEQANAVASKATESPAAVPAAPTEQPAAVTQEAKTDAAPQAQPKGEPAAPEKRSEAKSILPRKPAVEKSEGSAGGEGLLERLTEERFSAAQAEYNPKSDRDPMLSPYDYQTLAERERQRLAAIERERQRKLAEEKRRREEEERRRQLELARLKDPAREVRGKIHIGGIIGQEVFIGSKIYTVGNSVLGAKIVEITPDEVVFVYKGQKFVRKVEL